jgi:hypothetical protein
MSAATTTRRPRLRLALAVLLVLAAAVVLLVWRGTANVAVTASLEAADRGPAQGLTVTAHPDPWFVYTQNGEDVTAVTVTASDGTTLPVTRMSHRFTYGPHREGQQVGRFEVPAGTGLDELRVVVSPAPGQADVQVAVTTFDVAGFEPLVLWGGVALLVVNVLGAVALATSPRSRGRERRGTVAGQPASTAATRH